MVRECKVLSAAVDVYRVTEVLLGHGRALDVPARSSHAPWGLPCDLRLFLAGLPQSKVQRILLDFADSDPCAALEVIDVLSGQLAVFFELSCRIVDIAVSFISITLVDQRLYKVDDLRNVLGNLRMNVCLDDVERTGIFKILLDILLGYLRSSDAFLLGPVDDLVIYISEILYELDFVSSVFEIPSQRIEYDERSCVSYMKEVIDSRSTDIHLDLSLFNRHEFFLAVGQSIIDIHV